MNKEQPSQTQDGKTMEDQCPVNNTGEPTCTEEIFDWCPPFGLDESLKRVALIAGTRTIKTGLNLDNRSPNACINDKQFYLGFHQVTGLMLKLGNETDTFMGMVSARERIVFKVTL